MFVAYLITGVPLNALAIGGFEVFTKIGLFYLHERIWGKVWWGRISDHRDPVHATKTAEISVPNVEIPENEVVRPRKILVIQL